MRLLQRNAKVATRFGGGFVQAIDGLAGGAARPAGRLVLLRQRRRGVARARRRRKRARAATASGGTATTGAPPSASRRSSARSPSRSCTASTASACRCASNAPTPAGAPCRQVAERLAAAGVRGRARPGSQRASRRRCACSSAAGPALRDDHAVAQLERGPGGQRRVRAPPRRRARDRAARRARAHRADARRGRRAGRRRPQSRREQPPMWVVTGTDEAGVAAAAARASTRRRSRDRFALAVEPASCARRRSPVATPMTYRRARSPLHAARAGGRRRLRASRWPLRARARAPARARRRRRRRARRPRPPPACGREVGARRALRAAARRWWSRSSTRSSSRDGLTVLRAARRPAAVRAGRPHARGARLRRRARRCASLVDHRLLSRCFAAAVDPDELLRAFRRVSLRSALTAALATRLVPVLARDARRMADAQRCRPAAGAGRASRVLRAVTAGALDRAVDVAATLEVRGYGAARGAPARERAPWSRHDLAFARRRASRSSCSRRGARGRAGARSTAYPRCTRRSGAGERRCSPAR